MVNNSTNINKTSKHLSLGGRRIRDRMVVGFPTTFVISAYHHRNCEFESHSGTRYNIM